MKIYVYAICKNEEKFVCRWMKSMSEADGVLVADTGSSDGSVKILRGLGATVSEIEINPWRFDEARNKSLSLVPDDADICVCTDLDEYFNDGWRTELEKKWQKGITTRAKYKYTWSFNENGTPGVSFWYEKIHARHGFKWVHPVHEVLEYSGDLPDNYAICDKITLEHHPDKTKSRTQYLALLEMSVEESPEDDRNMHYLGREYMFRGRWDDCIKTLTHHLEMPNAKWNDERAASMRYIARAYKAKGDYYNAKIWLFRAIGEAPYVREGYAELAWLGYDTGDYELTYCMVNEALKIKDKPETYINEDFCWNYSLYDLGAIGAYNIGLLSRAEELEEQAAKMSDDKRIKNNLEIIKSKTAKSNIGG